MRLQNSTLCKWHATFGTGKWLFSCVGHFMRFQLTTSQICLVTFATRKWLPSSMDPCMPFRLLPWLCVNGLSQKEQANDFPPVWTFSCVFKEWLWANFFQKWGKEMASLLCGSCHFSSTHHFLEMTWYILNRQIAFLLNWSFHGPPNHYFIKWLKIFLADKWLFSYVGHFMCFKIERASDLSNLEKANGFSTVWVISFFF